jgi:glutamyl-tRNA reductase
MVPGEAQILGQVRDAYDAARAQSAAGPLLRPLFQRAIAAGKRVMHQTPLAEGRVSIASVAVNYARRSF